MFPLHFCFLKCPVFQLKCFVCRPFFILYSKNTSVHDTCLSSKSPIWGFFWIPGRPGSELRVRVMCLQTGDWFIRITLSFSLPISTAYRPFFFPAHQQPFWNSEVNYRCTFGSAAIENTTLGNSGKCQEPYRLTQSFAGAPSEVSWAASPMSRPDVGRAVAITDLTSIPWLCNSSRGPLSAPRTRGLSSFLPF